jgi:hypothetical protein
MIIIIPLVLLVVILGWMLRPRKKAARSRIAAILAVVIPVLLLAAAAAVFQLIHNAAGNTGVPVISNTLTLIEAGLIGAAVLAAAGFGIARKNEIAKGIGFGICINVVVFVVVWGLLEWLGGV